MPLRGGAAAPGGPVTGPVRIISDLHLGHRVSRIKRVESFRPLLAGVGTVVFNGDTWQELSKDLREESSAMLEELRELCQQEGCETVFLPGNHDPGWQGDGFLELEGGRVVVTHGDTLLRSGAPWKREILLEPHRVEALWQQRPAAAHDARERHQLAREISAALPALKHSKGGGFIQRFCDAIHPPGRALEMLKAWWSQPEMGERYCRTYFPQAEILIIGHFHWAGTWRAGGLRIINTGSFLNPGRAHWVDVAEGRVTYGRIDEGSGKYQAGRIEGRWQLGQ